MRAVSFRILMAVCVFVLVAWAVLLGCRFNGKVVAEQCSASSGSTVLVRAIQEDPSSINGLLGANDNIYRCEFYRKQGGPMTSCQSYSGESFFPNDIRIEWRGPSSAVVT